ncbi:MAG: ATPase [Lachnospiraceae bacterium]|jgi:sugar (pentulose or hexulose) kinase|nr:ATPase [Lachnospiraceae bacterium]
MDVKKFIEDGKGILGIEFGSTRIKAVLIDDSYAVIAEGGKSWENRYENDLFTYSLDDIYGGLQAAYKELKENVQNKYGVKLTNLAGIGISAMMHGLIALDKDDNLLTPFRTWRNTNTGKASEILTKEFNYNIPLRWSVSHIYQGVLDGEDFIPQLSYATTLAGLIHYRLTGKKVLGVGDASGMFPIDIANGDFNNEMIDKFEKLCIANGTTIKFRDYMPKILTAGENAGALTEEGAKLLDPSGALKAGIPLCPPEGDAGTGMVATNSVEKRTGNVSAGTSIFLMAVLEKDLKKVHEELDMVTTPSGDLVAMVHCNNCTSDINAWANIFKEYSQLMGEQVDMNKLFTALYSVALEGDKDCGKLLSYGYVSGEPVTGFSDGCPIFVRGADSTFNLANFMRSHIYSAMGALRVGMDILVEEEGVTLDKLMGHGGFFKTPKVGQSLMAAAMNTPVTTMKTAGEGGAWGIALLAAYLVDGQNLTLAEYLDKKVFANENGTTLNSKEDDVIGFNKYMEKYKAGLTIEKAATTLYYKK